jgi:hypothetical protein
MKALQRISNWLKGPKKETTTNAPDLLDDLNLVESQGEMNEDGSITWFNQGTESGNPKLRTTSGITAKELTTAMKNVGKKIQEKQMPEDHGYLKLAVLNVLQRSEQPMSNYHIRKEIYLNKHSYKIDNPVTERVVRDAIKDLRMAGQPICAGYKGYWLSTNKAEIVEQADKLYYTARGMNEAAQVLYDVAKGYK